MPKNIATLPAAPLFFNITKSGVFVVGVGVLVDWCFVANKSAGA